MQEKTKQGFVLSVLLHAAVVAGAVLFTLLKPLEKPKELIFELVAPSAAEPMEAVAEPTISFTAPVQVTPPPPKPPPPKPAETPPPKPVEKKPEPPKPKPPEVKPEPPPPVTTLEQFRKVNPQKPKPATSTPPKPIKVPRVDTKFTPNLRETVVNVDTLAGLSQIQQSELQNYIARLRAALELCWAKPAGLSQTIATEVEFSVAPSGALTRIRITRSSGNAEFDRSVLESFETLGTGGVTPEGKPLNLRLTFRMNEI